MLKLDFDEYQHLAARTLQCEMTDVELRANCAMGLAGEAGEVVNYLKKAWFHRHILDVEILSDELGDVLWYLSALASIHDLDLDEIAKRNIRKLEVRYPNGFTYADDERRTDVEQL